MSDLYKTETALQVLTLFSTSNDGIQRFSNQIIQDVKEGRADALKVKVYLKTLEQIAEIVDKATKPEQKSEAEKWGEKPFDFMGATLHLTATKTEYDYATSNDAYLQDLLSEADHLKVLIDQRKALLKVLGEPTPMANPRTGEIMTVYPPIKKSSMGVKVEIK